MRKRWMQYGLVGIAIVAAGIGITQVKHRDSGNSSWLAAVGQRVESNALGNQGTNGMDSSAEGAPAANEANQDSGNGGPASVTPPQPKSNQAGAGAKPSLFGSGSKSPGGSHSLGSANHTPSSAYPGNIASSPLPAAPEPGLGSFTVVVSEDKGQSLISRKTIKIVKGESLMAYMHQNYDVTTAYGDDFMLSINGIKSQWTNVSPAQRQPVDWFLYVNGTQAPVGAGDIVPTAGDVDSWDYHRWDPSTGKG